MCLPGLRACWGTTQHSVGTNTSAAASPQLPTQWHLWTPSVVGMRNFAVAPAAPSFCYSCMLITNFHRRQCSSKNPCHLMERKVELVSDQVPLTLIALLVGMLGTCHSTARRLRLLGQ